LSTSSLSLAQQVILAELRADGGKAPIDNRRVRASELLRRGGLVRYLGLTVLQLTDPGEVAAAEVVSRANLARLAKAAARSIAKYAKAPRGGILRRQTVDAKLRAASALRYFAFIYSASGDHALPNLPPWGDGAQAIPLTISGFIESGHGTAAQIAAYAAALDAWAARCVSPQAPEASGGAS
jgi:hypothetical protein